MKMMMWVLIGNVFAIFALWVKYYIVMKMKGLKEETPWYVTLFALPFGVISVIMDAYVQIFPATIIFYDLPISKDGKFEWMLTHRLERYKSCGTGWKKEFATLVCVKLLDPVDPSGKHCNEECE